MKRHPPRADIVALDTAIYSCACTYCGAKPNEACKQRATTRMFPVEKHASFPHMARVHAGHEVFKNRPVDPKSK